MSISIHIAGYEIVLEPAGLAVLAACAVVLALGVVVIVRMVRGRRRT